MKAAHRTPDRRGVYSRRAAIGLGAAALAGVAIGVEAGPLAASTTTPVEPGLIDALRPDIAPRSAWGAELPVTGTIRPEEDVRFLLVHHTASRNDYQPDEVAEEIRGFHRFHTGPEKGWPDVAYNFFVDRFGGTWEARQGSLDGPVRGDATGGSQGFALLCSLIGDHSQVPVPDQTRNSLIALLAWLAERHGIETEPGATVDFVSRGSNRWPAGAEVRAATISGHRDMSQTSCPGDFAYDLLAVDLPRAVTDRRREARAAVTTTSAPPATTVEPTTRSTGTSPTTVTTTTTDGDGDGDGERAGGPRPADADEDGGLDRVAAPAAVAGGAAVVAAAALAARRRAAGDGDGRMG